MAMATLKAKTNDLHRELLGLGVERLLSVSRGGPKPVSLASVPIPSGALAEKATKHAFDDMEEGLFNHVMRTYYFGAVIGADQFPDWHWDYETFYLTSVLHDLGLTVPSMDNTVLSFEYDGALQAREFLLSNGAEKNTADIVFEAIARHTGIYTEGKTPEGTLLSIGALLDVGGLGAPMLHQESLRDIVAKYPRLDLATRGLELMEYEGEKKNHQCHAQWLLDLGIQHMFGNNPLFGGHNH